MSATILQQTFLEQPSVQAPVVTDYRNRYNQFRTCCHARWLAMSNAAEIDHAATVPMTAMFADCVQGPNGKKQLAALAFCYHFLTRGC